MRKRQNLRRFSSSPALRSANVFPPSDSSKAKRPFPNFYIPESENPDKKYLFYDFCTSCPTHVTRSLSTCCRNKVIIFFKPVLEVSLFESILSIGYLPCALRLFICFPRRGYPFLYFKFEI